MALNYNGRNIKLVFLDTNALSNFVSNSNNFRTNVLNFLGRSDYEFCFNIDNVMELEKGYSDRYNSFLQIFSCIPCILFKLYPDIIKEEAQYSNTKKFDYSNISYSIVPGLGKEYELRYIISNVIPNLEGLIEEEQNLLGRMNKLKDNYSYSEFVKLNENYETEIVKDTLQQWNCNVCNNINLADFPAIRMINKSYYNRIVRGKKESIKRNDIHDIMISSVSPYVDMIITEAYQINVIKEAQKFIPQLQKLKCYKTSDFYSK